MTMLMKMSPFWLIMAVTTVALFSYAISLILNNLFGRDGFGTIGNMTVLTLCFFGGIAGAEYFGYTFRGLQMNAYLGMSCALVGYFVLALIKLIFDRIIR